VLEVRLWAVLMSICALAVGVLAGCAPRVDGPTEQQRAIDQADAARLTAQLSALPGVVRVETTLRRSVRDPLSMSAPSVPSLSAVVIVDDKADRASIAATTKTLARTTAPEVGEPTIVVEVGAVRPSLAKVGPFTVEESSKSTLKATLAIAFALIATLAIWVALRERNRQRRRRQSA
jgi:type III secretory pathway lipoprotein EscJ